VKNLVAEFDPSEVKVVLLDGVSDGKLLRVQLLPISDKPIAHPNFPKGLRFDRAFAEKLVANFVDAGKVPLDYLHGSEAPGAHPDQGVAAGWFKAVRIEGDEVVGYAEPTPRALAMVEAREYLLASAAMTMDWLNPRTGKRQGPMLTSAALTNRPFIRGMAEVAVVDRRSVTLSEAPASRHADGDPRPRESKMAESLRTIEPDTVSLTEHLKVSTQLTEVQAKLADAEKAKTAAEAKLSAAETEKVALHEQVKRLEGEKAKTARTAKFDALLREGRVIPAEKDDLLELSDAQFEKITSHRPKGMWKSKATGVTAELEDTVKDAGVKLSEVANAIAEKRKIGFAEAMRIARSEHPELADGTASEAVRRGLVVLADSTDDDSAASEADDE
jgi:phage I-like protein